MVAVLDNILRMYNFVFIELRDPRSKGLFLLESPGPLIFILVSYVYVVNHLGPRLMEKRAAFDLKNVLVVYNIIQIIVNLFLFIESLRYGWGGNYNWICQSIDWTSTPTNIYTCRLCYVYFILKLTDLLDTVFMVLRKKNDHISFLHVYHHTGMCALAWAGTKYLPGGHGTFLGFINVFVHTIMYTYYLISVVSPKSVSIQWKKILTQLQMAQFLLVAVHTSLLAFQPNCDYPKFVVFVLVPQNVFMFLLFLDFYRKAYSEKSHKKMQNTENNKKRSTKLRIE